MTREEIRTIIEGITDEQLQQILDINGHDIEKIKGRANSQKAELENLRIQVAEKDTTIASLEAAGGDIKAIQAELEQYKRAEADRKRAEGEAETDRVLTAAAEQALEGKEFVNDFTRAHFVSELKKAISDPANKGKRPADLFSDMTKDADGIFKNPQQEPLRIQGVDNHGGGATMTKDQIMGIKDAAERQSAITANMGLFQKG